MLIFANDYLLAWCAYGFAALGCLLVWFRLTRSLWRWLREPLRLILAVLLLTPTIVDPERELFAPAIAITALDLLFDFGGNAWRAVADLALYGLVGVGLYLIFIAIRWPIERRIRQHREKSSAADEDSRTLRERLDDDYPLVAGDHGRAEPRL